MRTFRLTSLALLVLLLGIAACFVPNIRVTDPSAEATLLAQTVMAIVAQTQGAVSEIAAPASESPVASYTPGTPTMTLTSTQTPTQTQTPTPIVIATFTPVIPRISVSVPTNCREGPGKAYPMEGALLVGEIAQVLGRDPTGNYWYIPNPDSPGEYCWIWGGYATLSGPTGLLPVFTPMPTPTPTFTPTPAPGFDASYEGLISCSSEWWPEISLENTGLVTFRSVGITVKDTVTAKSVSEITDGFIDRTDCSSSSSRSTLLPGKVVTISSPELADDPSGHKLRATITLCSKTGQNGVCVTETITFKP